MTSCTSRAGSRPGKRQACPRRSLWLRRRTDSRPPPFSSKQRGDRYVGVPFTRVRRPQLHSPNVLVVGIDPRAVPGMDVDAIEAALEKGKAEFEKRAIS